MPFEISNQVIGHSSDCLLEKQVKIHMLIAHIIKHFCLVFGITYVITVSHSSTEI